MLILALILVVLATLALLWAMWQPRLTVGSAVRRVEHYGYGGVATVASTAVGSRVGAAQRLLERFSPAGYEAALRARFLRAGYYNATPERILAFRFALPVVATIAGLAFALTRPSSMMLLFVVVLVILAFRIPEFILSKRISSRAHRMDREIADFIELLAITVEAGLGFEAAAQATIGRMTGPIREEFGLMLQEVRMGVARDESIRHVVARVDSRNLRVFAQALIQGQALGVPLAQILRNLAVDMRIRRRQAAEERAQKAPVKMVLATFCLILPSLLVVLLGPAAFRIYDAMIAR